MDLNINLQIVTPTPNIFHLADDENDSGGKFREFDESEIIQAAIESVSFVHRLGLVE